MTDRTSELLRLSLYSFVGLLVGLSIGISVGPQFQEYVMNNGLPKESGSWISMSLIFVAIMLNGFLYQSWKKSKARESFSIPTRQPDGN